MDNTKNHCDHVIGLCEGNTFDGAGTPYLLKVSGLEEAVADAEGFNEYHVLSENGLMDDSLLPTGERLRKAQNKAEDQLAKFAGLPIAEKLRKGTRVFVYCPVCGEPLAPILGSL